MNPEMQEAVEQQVLRALQEKEEEMDRELAELNEMKDDDLDVLRERRLADMKKKAKEAEELRVFGHGEYADISDEKEFFAASKKSRKMVVHFYRPSTWRCQIIDKHMSLLAHKHVLTRFVKVNVEKTPFLAERLRIMMLPTVMIIIDGKTDHSIVGFDELGGTDDFTTEQFEDVLEMWKVI